MGRPPTRLGDPARGILRGSPAAAWAATVNFSDTIRRASAGAVDPPAVSFHDRLTLIETDAQSVLLGRMEGLEEGVGDELRCHPGAVVGDG